MRSEALKLLEETLHNEMDDDFLDQTSKGRKWKQNWTNVWFCQAEELCVTEETNNRMKRLHAEWEKMFAGFTSEQGLTSSDNSTEK